MKTDEAKKPIQYRKIARQRDKKSDLQAHMTNFINRIIFYAHFEHL